MLFLVVSFFLLAVLPLKTIFWRDIDWLKIYNQSAAGS